MQSSCFEMKQQKEQEEQEEDIEQQGFVTVEEDVPMRITWAVNTIRS
jgi:hypothetical protein